VCVVSWSIFDEDVVEPRSLSNGISGKNEFIDSWFCNRMQTQSTFCSSQQERGDKNLHGKKFP